MKKIFNFIARKGLRFVCKRRIIFVYANGCDNPFYICFRAFFSGKHSAETAREQLHQSDRLRKLLLHTPKGLHLYTVEVL